MKMDTTTWILLAALLFLLLRKQQQAAAAGSLSGGYLPAAGAGGAAGAAGKMSLLQQLLNPGAASGSKPSAGIPPISSGAGGLNTPALKPIRLPSWLLPPRSPVALAPSPTLTSLIPSIAPPVWNSPTMNMPGDPIATIPSDTSGIFLTPEQPPSYTPPTLTSVTSTVYDPYTGQPISTSLGGDQMGDPTAFSPVDTQTIDTSTLGTISYLPDTPYVPPTIDPSTSGGTSTLWYDGSGYSGGGSDVASGWTGDGGQMDVSL